MSQVQRGARVVAILAAMVALGGARPAAAAGAIEINHATAFAGGVTASDTPGYPVTIDGAGSYVLTGNLRQTNPSVHAIEVPGSDVVLDLAGFAITGNTVCAASCMPTGSDSGIFAAGDRVVIRGGSVRGLANAGVHLAGTGGGGVEGVSASHNGGNGIRVAVRDSQIESNGDDGIDTIGGFFAGNRISGHTTGHFAIAARGSAAIQLSGNVLQANNGGDANPQISTTGAILQMGSNVCGSDLVCA